MFALIDDCTPNNGTIVEISGDPTVIYDSFNCDTMRVIKLNTQHGVGDRISIDWETQEINLADYM